jgi:predicted nucleotidyltransferase
MDALLTRAATVLFGKTRRALLGLFFTRPDESFHLREVVRLTGAGMGAVQRELHALVTGGILRRSVRSHRRVEYAAERASPVFDDLRSLMVRTAGMGDVLRAALAPLAPQIWLALVFGSFARAEQHRSSDVDLLVVSDTLDFKRLVGALQSVEEQLRREVNPVLYGTAEFRRKLATGNPFLRRVLTAEKIILIGNENEFTAMAEQRVASPARTRGGRDTVAASSRRSRPA